MDTKFIDEHIKTLVQKASKTTDGGESMRFSQAAQNLGNLQSTLLNNTYTEKQYLKLK